MTSVARHGVLEAHVCIRVCTRAHARAAAQTPALSPRGSGGPRTQALRTCWREASQCQALAWVWAWH